LSRVFLGIADFTYCALVGYKTPTEAKEEASDTIRRKRLSENIIGTIEFANLDV
jgi:hypothetical protein